MLENTFQFNIIVNENIIDTLLNIEYSITEYINNNMIHKRKENYILLKLLEFSFSWPKFLPNTLNATEIVKIPTQATFECMHIVNNMIINNLQIDKNNKLENLFVLKKKILDKIDFIGAYKQDTLNLDSTENIEKKFNSEDYFIISMIRFNDENTITAILDKFDINNEISFYIDILNINKNSKFIEIIKKNIDNKFNFTIKSKQNDTKYTINSLLEYIIKLKYQNCKIIFKGKNITIIDSNLKLVPEKLVDNYFNVFLINLFNYYIYFKTS